MKFKINLSLITFFLFFLLTLTPSVSAHMPGQPPFFKVNGSYANFYPVPGVSTLGIQIPQDAAPNNYLVNDNISFEVELKILGMPDNVIKTTTLYWDLGDGTKATGQKVTHSYSKPRSYFIKIDAKTPDLPQPQMLETAMIQILPSPNYLLPSAKVVANKETSLDPANKPLYFDLTQPINFAVTFNPSNAQVSDITWDFGDGTTTAGQSVVHNYFNKDIPGGLSVVTAVVRGRTPDGFLLDDFVMINDLSLKPTPLPQQPKTPSKGIPPIPVITFAFVVLLSLVFLIILIKNGRK